MRISGDCKENDYEKFNQNSERDFSDCAIQYSIGDSDHRSLYKSNAILR